MSCVEAVKFVGLINGTPSAEFEPSCGLQQGDPSSPYLSIICAHLFTLIHNAMFNNHIKGLQITKYCSHLFYVDDILFFFRALRNDC